MTTVHPVLTQLPGAVCALTAIVVTTLAVAGCSSSEATGKGSSAATASETLTAAGSIRVRVGGMDERVEGAACNAADGYDDVAEGADVVVTDAQGATVGTAPLRAGTLKFIDNTNVWCNFTFIVKDIPAGGKFYKLTAGQRDPKQLTESDLHSSIQLQIGD